MARPDTGTTTVSTAGTAVQVNSTSVRIKSIAFKARTGNTGFIYVGLSSVASNDGYELDATEGITFTADPGGIGETFDMSEFYADSSVSGDIVDWAVVLE